MNIKEEEKQAQIDSDIRKFSELVYTIAIANTESTSDADDVFQDVFVKYCKYFDRLKDDEHKSNWLKKATKHTAINFMKVKKRTNHLSLDENIVADPVLELEDEKLSPIINYLRKSYRVVLELYYYNDLHVKEISETLNLTENAVKTRLKRGREELRKIVNKVGF